RVLDWRYDDQVFARNGVEARLEWLAKRIASTGKYKLTQINNEQGIQSTVDVDFAIPVGNQKNAATDWSDPNADILADIKAIKAAAKAANKPAPRFAWCEEETIDNLSNNIGIQKFVASYIINALGLNQEPNLETINAAMRRKGYPEFIVWKSEMVQEN